MLYAARVRSLANTGAQAPGAAATFNDGSIGRIHPVFPGGATASASSI